MSEGQKWLWRFYRAQLSMYYDTVRWLQEAGLANDTDLPVPPNAMMWYWQRSGQYEFARAYIPNTPPREGTPFAEQINAKPPAL